ncbi:MAG: tetratricopeptide repeat protein, partial [Gemmatimonadota bacterium]
MNNFIREVHRRSLWQVLGIYLMGSWVVLQVVDQLHQTAGLPDWVPSLALVLLLIGLPMCIATAFIQEGMPGRDHAPEQAPEPTPVAESGDVQAAAPAAPATKPSWLRGNVFTWRNAIAGGIAALALFGAATAAWMVMRSAGVGTAGTLVARGLITDGERVVLADFSGDSALATAATMSLRVQLAESGVVSVAEPALVANVLQRMNVEGGRVDLERAREVAEREGFKAVVGGDVAGAGGGYIVTARVIETASGAELVNVGETVSDPADFLSAVDQLGRKLRERLGESLGSIRETAPLERATTTSIEALRKYSRAVQAFDDRDMDQAIALLDEAIALDSSFAMAWRKLAVSDDDRSKEAATRAYELRDRLTERERYHTVGLYHFYVTDDSDEAITTFRALIEAYPDDATGLNNLAASYREQGQLDLAVEMRPPIQGDDACVV